MRAPWFSRFLVYFLIQGVSSFLTLGAQVPAFRTLEIDNKIEIGYGVAVADVDGDGKPDILLVDKRQIVWYQNGSWKKHVMVETLTPADHVCIAAADINGDGKAEVAVGAGWNPSDTTNSGAVFYLEPPADRTARWTPIALPHDPTVHRMRWIKVADGNYHLVVVPLHGRGNKDGQGAGVRVLEYEMPTDPHQPWKTTVIDDSMHLTHNFTPISWDTDAEDELLVAGKEGVFYLDRAGVQWKKQQLIGNGPGETAFPGAGEIRLGHLANRARFLATVEPMHGTQLVMYTPPLTSGAQSLWTRHVLDTTLVDGHALACADFLNSGVDQVVVGWRAMGKPAVRVGLKMFVLPKDPSGEAKSFLIDDNGMACEDLTVADLNGDGKLDIVASGRATKNVRIYFNESQ